MGKNDINDALIKNLKGFCQMGADVEDIGNVPTGHFQLDFIIHYGIDPSEVDLNSLKGYNPSTPLGLPFGKLVEIFGEEGGGKSSLAYRVAGYAQKSGYPVAWIDTEHSFAKNLAMINGCDPKKLLYSNLCNHEDVDKVFFAEDVLDSIMEMCKGGIKVIILDSVANLVPKKRGEAESEQQFMGLLPRLLSENLGKITQYAEKFKVLLIFINQLREKLNVMWGNPETSPGGRSLKHNASVRLKVSKKGGKDANIYLPNDSGKEILIGRYARVNIEKNRLAKPFIESLQIPIYYEPYFPDIEDVMFDTGRQLKMITVRNGIFSWNDAKAEGRKPFIDYIKANKLVETLAKEIKIKAVENSFLLPPELMQYEVKDEISGQVQGSGQTEDSTSSESKSQKSRGKRSPGLSKE
jgi:recombination protein RecA